jgi:hypothetical protein
LSTLYERLFGRDWDSITPDEALKRAYVLGVTSSTGKDCEDELERLLTEFEGGRDESLIELAFDEGVHHDSDTQRKDSPNGFADEGWVKSVRDTIENEKDMRADPEGSDAPDALSKTGALDRYSPDSTDATKLPDLLRRR